MRDFIDLLMGFFLGAAALVFTELAGISALEQRAESDLERFFSMLRDSLQICFAG